MEKIREILEKIIKDKFPEVAGLGVEVSEPPELEETGEFRADVATNVAMKLAGALAKQTGEKRNPREVAEVLRQEFLETVKEKVPELEGTKIEIAGPGFLNFMLPDGYFWARLGDFATDFEKNISQDEYKGKVVVTEFSDPNPFKVLHIGHLYTSIVGEAISRLIELAGGEVHRVNFGGDVGLHVAKTLYALDFSKEFTIEDIAKAYVEGTRLYEEDEKAREGIVKLNKEIYGIVATGRHEGELAEAYWRGRELSYRYFDEFYARIGVKFEKYYPESTVAERGLKAVREHVPEVYRESDGAVVFPGEEYGLHTRVFINQEGLPTYETKDVGLLFQKDEDYHFDESVVITGNDIIDYMKVVLKSVEQYAPELVAKTRHITHGNVRLPGNEKMSSRKGNFIKAVEVLEQAPLNAIRYSFLKYKIGGNIEFDAEESVSLAGNSGPYLQYSAVRAKKILKALDGELSSSDASGASRVKSASGVGTPHPQPDSDLARPSAGAPPNAPESSEDALAEHEILLIRKAIEYPRVLGEAVREMAPHLVCNYLFGLAQEFSRFYENCKVAGDPREAERGMMVRVFYQIMEHGLGLLGIEIPEEM